VVPDKPKKSKGKKRIIKTKMDNFRDLALPVNVSSEIEEEVKQDH